jgi:uncharacterized protein YidB (DUF937 family)
MQHNERTRIMKRTTALFTTAAVAASLFAGVAFTNGAQAAVDSPAAVTYAADDEAGERRGHKHRPGKILEGVSEFLDMTSDELREALADGTTLADVAADQGVSVEDLTAAMTDAVEARLLEAVADGKLTQERADELLANSADHIDQIINASHTRGQGMERREDRREAVADFIGLSQEDIRAAFEEGSTLAEVAADQGISEGDLTAFLIDYMSADIDEAVANGQLTQERGDAMKERLGERIEARINATPGEGHPHRPHRGGRG